MENSLVKYQKNATLMRKLMTICPVCKKMIFGRDIDFEQIAKLDSTHWPISYQHNHFHNDGTLHNLTLYIDANFSVRETLIHNLHEL